MEKFPSKDGTLLAYQRTGSGPPLVLIHGTGASSTRWMPVLPALEAHFTIYALNRRGRGGSGDTPQYALEREFEDVAALVNSVGRPVNLLGHSFGAICALEASLRTRYLHKLILYEPPIPIADEAIYPEGLIDRLEALLDAGDRENVLTMFVQEVLHMPAHEFQLFRASPAWASRIAAAHTLPRELRAQMGYHFVEERFKGFMTPTLLIVGADSPSRFKAATNLLAATLPNSRTVILPGQQHIAMDTAPELFVQKVMDFLMEAG
jgi:pimeloyl-ACP methyl ester carboxylesterase